MEYELTKHATNVIAERDISDDWIDKTLTSPDLTEADNDDPQLEHRLKEIPETRIEYYVLL